MSRFPTYPSYRNTSREWFPEIPTHWRDSKLRWLSKRYAGGTPDKNRSDYWEDGIIPWLNSGAVNQGTITEPSELITVEGFNNSSAKWIPVDALVMALAGQGKTKGMVAQTKIRTTCNQSMAAIVIYNNEPRYIYWWLCSQYRNIRGLTSDEGRDGLNLEIVGGIHCPLPPLEEQQTIARFLDHKTAQIDALIAKKKALLDKLAEKRTTLISHAVTKGLDPSAPMKDSGVPWLGKIPAHWSVRRIKDISALVTGMTPSTADQDNYTNDDGFPWIRPEDLTEPASYLKASKFLSLAGWSLSRKVPRNSTLICCIGTIGKTGYALSTVATNQQITAACFYKNHKYFFHAINAARLEIELSAMGNVVRILNNERLGIIPLPVPPDSEAIYIARFLDEKISEIEQQAERIQQAISKLHEYRAALITHAVTGKIDVRNIHVPLNHAE